MNFERVNISAADGHNIPGFLFTGNAGRGGALLIPAYGGSKEHMLPLAAVLAESGWAALTIDLCGHGDNTAPLGPSMVQEIEAAMSYLRRYGRTAAVGLSLGGRLALSAPADRMVAISPSVITEMSPQGKWMFENFPSPAVREPYAGYVVKLLEELGPVKPHAHPSLILYSERDIPAILNGAAGLKATLPQAEVRYIKKDTRPDVQHENGFIRYLPRWFNHGELKFNYEVLQITADWLAEPAAHATRA